MRLRDETAEIMITRVAAGLLGLVSGGLLAGYAWLEIGHAAVWKVAAIASAACVVGGRFLWIAATGDSETLNELRERSEEVRARSLAYHTNSPPPDRRTHQEKVRAFRDALFQAEIKGSDAGFTEQEENE